EEDVTWRRRDMPKVQVFPKTDLKAPWEARHSRICAVPVMFMVTCRNKERVSECFPGHVPASLKQRILGTIRINILPGDRLGVPRLGGFCRLCGVRVLRDRTPRKHQR